MLLSIPIGKRVAAGFVIPALIAIIALSSIASSSQQLLARESTFYRGYVQANVSSTDAMNDLQQMHLNLQGMLNDAGKPGTTPATLREDHSSIQGLVSHYNTILATYEQQDILDTHPDLAQLMSGAGQASQLKQQRVLSEQVMQTWSAYHAAQDHVLNAIAQHHLVLANTLVTTEVEQSYAHAMSSLLIADTFNSNLEPSLYDALTIEENKLLLTTLLAALSILFGIGIVGWLISSTLVRRLQQARATVQAIEQGQIATRLNVDGRDEITDVSISINRMLDTIVGLLEETRAQRDELVRAEELRRSHEELQQQRAHLEALATADALTGLPNHRTIMDRIEQTVTYRQQAQETFALLFIDLDHFKKINDTLGHQAGDAILCEVSHRLKSMLQPEDLAGRYGGEEFALVLTNVERDGAKAVAERIRAALADQPCLWSQEQDGGETGRAI